MSDTLTDLYQIDALGPSGPYRARRRSTVTSVSGEPVAELSLVPVPYVSRAMAALRSASIPPREQRLEMIRSAGEAFRDAEIAGLSAEQYLHMVARISGLGISELRSAVRKIAEHAATAWERTQFARPEGVAEFVTDARTRGGSGIWARRGRVFGVHASGNHPGIHGGWLEALALGYRVAVRPSRREPLTAHRLVSALWGAGFAQDQVIMLPTEYDAADELLRLSDLAMAYGGQEVMEKYRHLDVLPQGPGRSKMLLTSGVDWRAQVDTVVDSATRGGGAGCTNVTSVLVEGDAATAEAFGRAIAEKLAKFRSLPPEDPEAVLPVHPVDSAQETAEFVASIADGTIPVLGSEQIVEELGDGSAALRPSVHVLSDSADLAEKGVELRFPCVWVAPWTRENGVEPLRNTLNLVLMGADEELVEAALEDGSIRNVYAGERPSYFSGPAMPHDGYLASFLMRPKGFVSA